MTPATTLLVAAAFGACLTFVAVYGTTAPWYRSEMGWHMMAFVFSLGLILGLSLAYRIWGEYPGRKVLLIVAFGLLTVLLWQRVYLVIRAQRPPTKHRAGQWLTAAYRRLARRRTPRQP